MGFEYYKDIGKFTDDVMEVVAAQEVQNNLIIANCMRGKGGMDTSDWFMGTLKDAAGSVEMVAIMTPPFNLVLYEIGNRPNEQAEEQLIHEILDLGVQIPGVMAEKSLTERITERFCQKTGRSVEAKKYLRIYQLDRVKDIPLSPGFLRLAEEGELYYLPYWQYAFTQDCNLHHPDLSASVEQCKRLVKDQRLHIWEDGAPVSQAALGRRTLNGAVVNEVYTPPHFRGKGYASSCVASLSREALESGYSFCCLFTDLMNPVSNSIYQKIGYYPICDYDEWTFNHDKPV